MRDLHDGLGSQLFVTLSRVEMGEIEHSAIVQALRDCIADMRLALEASSPDSNNFLEAWGNFRFRWESQLAAAGLQSIWEVEAHNDVIELAPHAGLQLPRIAQEALTNVLKHAVAHDVQIRLNNREGTVRLAVSDDGRGLGLVDGRTGRGLANMRARPAAGRPYRNRTRQPRDAGVGRIGSAQRRLGRGQYRKHGIDKRAECFGITQMGDAKDMSYRHHRTQACSTRFMGC